MSQSRCASGKTHAKRKTASRSVLRAGPHHPGQRPLLLVRQPRSTEKGHNDLAACVPCGKATLLRRASDRSQPCAETPQRNVGVAVNKSGGAGLQAKGFKDGFHDSGSQLPPEQDACPWNQSWLCRRSSLGEARSSRYPRSCGFSTTEVPPTAFSAQGCLTHTDSEI